MSQNTISLNEEEFKKTSKKLLHNIQSIKQEDLTLSAIQEALSKSLGFRSLHDLQNTFSKSIDISDNTQPTDNINIKNNIFITNNSDGLTEIIISLMHDSGESVDMWKGRAISLISVIMMALVYMRDEKEIILGTEIIRHYLTLDMIIKMYKTRRDFPNHIRTVIRDYLIGLPGFQENAPTQNDIVFEHHGYLLMQILQPLNKLQKIEKEDIILVEKDWIEANPNKFIIKSNLSKINYIEYSWLYNECFQEIILNLISKNEQNSFNNFTMNDLLIYKINMVHYKKHSELNNLISNILDNYSSSLTLSKNIISHIY